jgi:hypothetical protein
VVLAQVTHASPACAARQSDSADQVVTTVPNQAVKANLVIVTAAREPVRINRLLVLRKLIPTACVVQLVIMGSAGQACAVLPSASVILVMSSAA